MLKSCLDLLFFLATCMTKMDPQLFYLFLFSFHYNIKYQCYSNNSVQWSIVVANPHFRIVQLISKINNFVK